MKIDEIDRGLYRIRVPFEEGIFTSVYVIVCDEGAILVDAATYPKDVDESILPALDSIGILPERVRWLLLSHEHGDHAGGAERALACFPEARFGASFPHPSGRLLLLTDGEVLLGRLQVVALPGHTERSLAFYDRKTKTLLTADCLQLRGIGKYRNGIAYPTKYRESVRRVRELSPYRIVAAHEYDPLGSVAQGEEAVTAYLDACLAFISDGE